MSPLLSYTGVDVLRDDGVYTASLLTFQKNGFNSVIVRATAKGVNETRLVVGGRNRAYSGKSEFHSDHCVDFSAPTCCQSATFVRQLFAFYCPLYFTNFLYK